MTALIDTNVLIAILNSDEKHHDWCVQALEEHKALGPAVISDIIYSELAMGMNSKEDVDTAIQEFGLERLPADDKALFRAGVAFKAYKGRKGQKTNVLPDFLIGAAAEVAELPLITANPKDFSGYFPTLTIISPE